MQDTPLLETTYDFILRCRREDGGYAPSPDPAYPGNSDTRASDLAAATYAAVLAHSLGRELPDKAATADFFRRHQQPDGSFRNLEGSFAPQSDLAVLYNTTQGVVGLRALGERPPISPVGVMDRFFEGNAFQRLPWYTTSFFPLFYAASDAPFPEAYRQALSAHMQAHQTADGYLGDHVAATFHMAHFFRLVGEPTPRAAEMVERTLRDQAPDGGWHIKAPDWDVHACFDALFILRQLGGGSERCRAAIERAADWALRCRNDDGGFGHYPGWHSDMDAVYFQCGALFQAGRMPDAASSLPDAHTLGWGHAMRPDWR
ncbi:MAG TPA: prenyltransferase/squalene oxidase repeat-containing protein [Chthonomonadaceae bacterium]|nr:prenyltransferase/squalene oxidase repeat-containing protein [Chthonomonadaceae bacterium]